ncbi:valine--tRNA ligase [Candidatus Saccharibacteria bacterium]|nr:MAG: valine--tRNA ligase [Candidatus Saccharibacteria bacterium]
MKVMHLSKVYEPSEYESDIYALWEKSEVFFADPSSKKERFSIAMPPPNETGTLSIGHALFLTLQDIMARYQRMQGKDVLWLPGTDHAALPVNAIVEKQLADEGTTKHEIGRDAFLERTRAFVEESRGTMLGQMRAMGASCDWSRLRYTLNDSLSRCVNETFVKMYEAGIIYRGHRIVNWDPNLETNVSDDEVSYQETKGKFYTFRYGPFEIGTARPETKFGDKYVVMHPDDERYAQYAHGQTLEVEWINGPITATIIKDTAVDPSFGTGVMTITPWHSQVDFDMAQRHGLDKEQIIDFHGRLLPIAQEFSGMTIEEARPKIVEKLKEKGLLVGIDENYVHNVAINERGKGVIEPQVRLQWFVDVNKPAVDWKGKQRSLKETMQSVVRDGDITVMPKRFEKLYFHWIDNLRDWCISRQIWWGHRIPAWYRTDTDGVVETYVGLVPPTDDESQGWNEWQQDPDTLDTWFSSALWTWSTLVDPELAADPTVSFEDLLKRSPDFAAYHPTSVMETGWDILFFWVARMILSTTFMTGQVPFRTVYLHGLIRAEDGKKMSKSRPKSIIDPLDVIPRYGTDALRMALIMGVTPGNDQNWGWGKCEANRNFCNKLWNVARYTLDKVGELNELPKPAATTNAEHWVLGKLQHTTEVMGAHLDAYRFSEAYDTLYHFVWDDVADWYIEVSKSEQGEGVLAYVLNEILKLAHPFAPFVTETIWQVIPWTGTSILAVQSWPEPLKTDKKAAADFEEIRTIVTEVRALTRSLGLRKPHLYYTNVPFLTANADVITRLTGLAGVREVADGSGLHLTSTAQRCWLDVDAAVVQAHREQLSDQIAAQEKQLANLQNRLSNKNYVKNAPQAIVQETKEQLAEAKAVLERLQAEYRRFTELR